MSVAQIEHFLTTDYATIFPADTPVDRFFSLFANPWVPIVSVILYLALSDVIFEFIRDTFKIKPKGFGMQTITVLHSLALAVYSGWTFVNSSQLVYEAYLARGSIYGTLCDPNLDLWDARGFGFWVTHFYISKYYEFIDTWIVILKGRKPMFLQTYHHAGVVLICWGFVVTKNTGLGVVLVTFNSFIHTLMYTYYVFAAFGFNSPLKKFLTQAQILQFLIGGGVVIPLYWSCLNPAQTVASIALHVYLVVLIYLFAMFYVKSYSRKTK